MKKMLILFHYHGKNFSITKKEIKNLEKNYTNIILYNFKYKSKTFAHNKKNLNEIRNNYLKSGIVLDIKKIYEINFFLYKIRNQNKEKKIFLSPYFISGIILEEEFIFYELSRIYKIQFLRPELSFIKNRFILAKSLYKQPYLLKKKTKITKKNYELFKSNYALSMQSFSERNPKSKLNLYISKILINVLNFFLKLRFNDKPKKYALVILNNNKYLNILSKIINMKDFINKFLNHFNFQLVFLIHPNSNPFIYFLKILKRKNFFYQNKRIIFLHKPKNLINIIQNSEFVIHLSSSLSAQSLIFNKKILCLGKNNIYIQNLTNIISNIGDKNFNFLKKKFSEKDALKIDKFLIGQLSNSVNKNGEFKLYTNKKNYIHLTRSNTANDKRIIQNLLNAL